ncbi:hypothetical protein BKA00_002522 [Actinomadura coerulea]|uniref:Uncharacterized protein n=1 Tax=Actinomadura coerulea TaxID=46159 RepID=A0A7X0FXM5_9ACTN|nr:hypothetical protein [Actinomadura coerulea]MBB6395608.1 hypothetical protein [Actinomadura coerulea]GGQ25153.1 hypothetical protein GCM10010187_46960 [Actinomadura coerulea]
MTEFAQILERWSEAADVVVADESTARRIAEVFIERGYTQVLLTPCTYRGRWGDEPGWRVLAWDDGPYPDDDIEWWTAEEHRFVARLKDAYGVRHPSPPELGSLDGLLVDRTTEDVREFRMASFAHTRPRAQSAVVPRLLDHGPLSLSGGGEPITLTGLDDVDWSTLGHAYGSADDTPDILRALAANDEGWSDAVHEYFSAIVHQDTVYSATERTIPFLVQIALSPSILPERRLELLRHLLYIASQNAWALSEPDGDSPGALTAQAVAEAVPDLLALWQLSPQAHKAQLLLLGALNPSAATTHLKQFTDFRASLDGPSPTLDLALALITEDEPRAQDIALQTTTWDVRTPDYLAENLPLNARLINVLLHLAGDELS